MLKHLLFGAYFEERSDVVSAAQCHWSRLWWDHISNQYEVIISEAVINELANPNYPYSQDAVALVDDIQHLELISEVYEIVNIYIERKLMPEVSRHLGGCSAPGSRFIP